MFPPLKTNTNLQFQDYPLSGISWNRFEKFAISCVVNFGEPGLQFARKSYVSDNTIQILPPRESWNFERGQFKLLFCRISFVFWNNFYRYENSYFLSDDVLLKSNGGNQSVKSACQKKVSGNTIHYRTLVLLSRLQKSTVQFTVQLQFKYRLLEIEIWQSDSDTDIKLVFKQLKVFIQEVW